jgi:hypothetical protein
LPAPSLFGKPVRTATYYGKPISVPAAGKFAAFVLIKVTN